VRLGNRGYLDVIERAVSNGETVLIENLGEATDPVLDPLLGRNTIKKGKFIKMGDKEVDYHPNFRLILHTKLANPHYQPEMQAQCTLINFTVTREGLEDQLLADVVRAERPDLEELKAALTTQQNEFKITLKGLEDDLLARLSAASGNFLGDTALVENLETTKKTATEIEIKVKEAKITEIKINEAREHYRPGANRASLLYFILDDLNKIHPMYQFSLKAFNVVFAKSIEKADTAENVKARVDNLIDSVTYSVYVYATRGLFEKDKLTFTAQVAFQVLLNKGEIVPSELDFLLRFPIKPDQGSPVDFLSNNGWGGVKALSDIEEFKGLDRDIEGSAKRWKKFVESECPEKEKFPQEWKTKTSLQKLCMMRCFRPDRMTYAVTTFIEEKLHPKYVENRSIPFEISYEESGPGTPMFFILSPGVDPLKDVEAVGKKLGFTFDNRNFHNVSLGQGQEVVAEEAMKIASEKGHWVILQNIHLVAKWLPMLEKKLEQYAIGADPAFR
jgi:dynein heavy chain